jgi:putative SOS response-associated peptidase YedK
LYSLTKGQQAIREWAGVMAGNDRTGNLPPMPGIFPDYSAAIVGDEPEGRMLAMARWGMPTPPKYLEGRKTDPGVTNIRNVNSLHCGSELTVAASFRSRVFPRTSFYPTVHARRSGSP